MAIINGTEYIERIDNLRSNSDASGRTAGAAIPLRLGFGDERLWDAADAVRTVFLRRSGPVCDDLLPSLRPGGMRPNGATVFGQRTTLTKRQPTPHRTGINACLFFKEAGYHQAFRLEKGVPPLSGHPHANGLTRSITSSADDQETTS